MSNWNDDRLDKLERRVDEGFTKVEGQVVRLEGEMDKRFDKLDYTLLTGAIAIIGALIGFHG